MAGEKKLEVITLPSGVKTELMVTQAYDWPSIRLLAEKGVGYKTISRHFNGLDPTVIAKRAHFENWLTPARERKMRRELKAKQKEALARNGQVRDPDTVMEEIWRDRQNRIDEKTFAIVEEALDGVDEETARTLIAEAKDLKTIMDVGRKVTGQEKRDAKEIDSGPKLALNVEFLRSAGGAASFPTTPAIDV